MNNIRIIIVLIGLILLPQSLSGQSTQFTYQGTLETSGNPANGNHDFDFLLFDALNGGTQAGATVSLTNVVVADGVFSVSLDFGDQFPGASRFLEIRVRPSGQGGMTILAPRQMLASAPYAIKSVNAANADNATNAANATNAVQLGGVASSEYVLTTDPRMTDARNPLPGSGTYIQNGTTVQPQANFNIGGDGTVGGTISAPVVSAGTQFNLGSGRIMGANNSLGNLFVGFDSGNSNTSGTNNSFFGTEAGRDNVTGGFNSFFGRNAGANNQTGIRNSFYGSSAGFNNISGSWNAFFGEDAGAANTSSQNSFFGTFAGQGNTSGSGNAFFGYRAGANNTTGVRNSFYGSFAGHDNIAASSNTFFGYEAGRGNTSGTLNSFFGSSAGTNNDTGSNNAFFGTSAGFNNTNGSDNSFFGYRAGPLNSTGTDNAFFGTEAGSDNTTGGFNSFFGRSAGFNNTIGAVNVFVGSEAGTSNTSGGANVFVGSDAGGNNTTGASNSFIGRDAGDTNVSGSNNSALGRGSDVGSGALSFATAIGSDAVVNSSNTVQLGRNGLDIVRIGTLGPGGATSLCINGGNDIASCSSSIRYKSNIEGFYSGLSLIRKLRPVLFNWLDGGARDMGLVAEEVVEVEPLLTTTRAGKVEGVKYDRLGVVLVNAVLEQQKQIEASDERAKKQEQEIERLRNDVLSLKAIICELKPEAAVCKVN